MKCARCSFFEDYDLPILVVTGLELSAGYEGYFLCCGWSFIWEFIRGIKNSSASLITVVSFRAISSSLLTFILIIQLAFL